MALNGLEAGDSIQSTDTFSWFRGNTDPVSPGRRDVRFSELVAFLNDEGVGGSSAQIDLNSDNIAISTMRGFENCGDAYAGIANGTVDVFVDESGIDTVTSTAVYDGAGDYYSNGASDFLLQSEVATANEESEKARVFIRWEDVSTTAVLNTDIKAFVSRDNGVTFTEGVLVERADYSATEKFISLDELDISGQASGVSMIWKIETYNSKEQRIHGAQLQWV